MELLRDLLFPMSILLSILCFSPFQDYCISLPCPPVCVLAFGFYYFLYKVLCLSLYSIQTIYWSLTCAYEWPRLLYAGSKYMGYNYVRSRAEMIEAFTRNWHECYQWMLQILIWCLFLEEVYLCILWKVIVLKLTCGEIHVLFAGVLKKNCL
jgi:hypothetical protein